MRGLWLTAREEEGSAVVVGTETNSDEVTVIRGGNSEGELLRWTRRDEEGLGSCGGARGSLYRPRGGLWDAQEAPADMPKMEQRRVVARAR